MSGERLCDSNSSNGGRTYLSMEPGSLIAVEEDVPSHYPNRMRFGRLQRESDTQRAATP
jgi:hypothetical protein